jgi:hypothetical protein
MALVDILKDEGWVHTPRLLAPGLFVGDDGAGNKIPLLDDGQTVPSPVVQSVEPMAISDPAADEDPPTVEEDEKFKSMKKPELRAYLLNNYGESVPATAKRSVILDRIKTLEGL